LQGHDPRICGDLSAVPASPEVRRRAARPGSATSRFSAFNVEGTLRHAERGGDWEYCVVLSIRNERGEEISRQVVGVGALRPSEARSFTLAVEVDAPGGS
jgi:hypothetical protein